MVMWQEFYKQNDTTDGFYLLYFLYSPTLHTYFKGVSLVISLKIIYHVNISAI